MKHDATIRRMDRAGKSQAEIIRETGLSRGVVQNARRRMGLITTPYRGWRKPPSPQVEKKFLALLNAGMSKRGASRTCGIPEHLGVAIAKRAGFENTPAVDPKTRAKVVRAIRARSGWAYEIAMRYHVSVKYVCRLAHEIYGVSRFRPGYGSGSHIPFLSNFPEKETK